MRKLGKKAPRIDKRTLRLEKYLTPLPPVPSAIDWTGKVAGWGMMLNDSIGDCTCAAAGHMDMLWTANAGTEIIPADSDILTAYEAVSGYNGTDPSTDNGADELTVLNFWRVVGIGGRKITSYVQVDYTNQQMVQASVSMFGALYIGVQVPQSAMVANENGQTWTDTTDTDIVGGHAIPIVAYDSTGLTCVTWGGLQKMTWAWFEKYCDEAYAVLSTDWIAATGNSPSGFDMAQLQSDLKQVQDGNF